MLIYTHIYTEFRDKKATTARRSGEKSVTPHTSAENLYAP